MRICTKLELLLLFLLIVPLAAAKTIVQPTDRPVSLRGTLRIIHGFGPPGYGEDKKVDAKISYWVLDLPFNVSVACTPSRADLADIECGSTDRLRLFFPIEPSDSELESRAKKLMGRKVIVTGVVRRRTAMIQITPVYMNVLGISIEPPRSK